MAEKFKGGPWELVGCLLAAWLFVHANTTSSFPFVMNASLVAASMLSSETLLSPRWLLWLLWPCGLRFFCWLPHPISATLADPSELCACIQEYFWQVM